MFEVPQGQTPISNQPSNQLTATMAEYHLPVDLPATPMIKKRSRWPLIAGFVVMLLALGGGGAWAYTYYFPSPQRSSICVSAGPTHKSPLLSMYPAM